MSPSIVIIFFGGIVGDEKTLLVDYCSIYGNFKPGPLRDNGVWNYLLSGMVLGYCPFRLISIEQAIGSAF